MRRRLTVILLLLVSLGLIGASVFVAIWLQQQQAPPDTGAAGICCGAVYCVQGTRADHDCNYNNPAAPTCADRAIVVCGNGNVLNVTACPGECTPPPTTSGGTDGGTTNDCTGKSCGAGTCFPGANANDGGYGCNCNDGTVLGPSANPGTCVVQSTGSGTIGDSCVSNSDCQAGWACISCDAINTRGKVCGSSLTLVSLKAACESPGSDPTNNPLCVDAARGVNGFPLFGVLCTSGQLGRVCRQDGFGPEVRADACGATCPTTISDTDPTFCACEDQACANCPDTKRKCFNGGIINSGTNNAFIGCGDVVAGGDGNACHNCYRNLDTNAVSCLAEGSSCGAKPECFTSGGTNGGGTTDGGGGTTNPPDIQTSCTYLTQTTPSTGTSFPPGQSFVYTAEFVCTGINTNLKLVVIDQDGNEVGEPSIIDQATQTFNSGTNTCTYTFNWTATDLTDDNYDVRLISTGVRGSEIETPVACTEELAIESSAVEQPAFTVTKSSSSVCTDAGATLNYTITARNIGNVAAQLDFVEDTLPAGIDGTDTSQVINIQPAPTQRTATTLRWDVNAILDPAETRTYTYSIVLDTPGAQTHSVTPLNNSVLIQYGDEDSTAEFENSVTVNCLPDTSIFSDNPVLTIGLLLILAGIVINRSGVALRIFGIEANATDASTGLAQSLMDLVQLPDGRNKDEVFEDKVMGSFDKKKKRK